MAVIRTTKTASGKTAVQVVERDHQRTKIIKHVGSAGSDQELSLLKQDADQIRIAALGMMPLFPDLFPVSASENENSSVSVPSPVSSQYFGTKYDIVKR